MSVPAKHKKGAKKHYKCAILTISTSKYWNKEKGEKDIGDLSGEIAKELVTRNGHEVVIYDVLPDDEAKNPQKRFFASSARQIRLDRH
ncbi:MAG: hypothetical protein ISS94_01730 [Candidatus Syntrophoarchaeum sp.]|nr:hypothetical protein [Methanomicrobia archaeon]MBL7117492.1 hypothetical protein [Candidatus Syntrophoarchaeum sp.]